MENRFLIIPEDTVNQLLEGQKKLLSIVESNEPTRNSGRDFVSRAEFMRATFMGATKFANVIKRLRHTRQGRTILIPVEEMLRYQRGEIRI